MHFYSEKNKGLAKKSRKTILYSIIIPFLLFSPSAFPESFNFSIREQALPVALDHFSRQSGYQISADAALLEGKTSPAVEGNLSLNDALNLLLSFTNLQWFLGSEKTIVIQKLEGTIDGMPVLPIVQVSAEKKISKSDIAFSAPGSSSYISQKEIERFRGTSVGDIFQGQSGVLVGENRNSGGLDVNIRGMQGQGRVPVIVDGSRQETTVYRGYSGVVSRSYIDPDLIAEIDIHKGPTLRAQSTGATGGTVEMRTISAEDIVLKNHRFGLRLKTSAIGNSTAAAASPGTPSGLNPSNADSNVYRTDCATESLCSGPYDLKNAFGPDDSMDRPKDPDLRSWSASLALAARFDYADVVFAHARRQQGNYYAGRHGPDPSLDLSNRVERGFWTEVRPELTGASRFRAEEMISNTNFESKSTLLKSKFYLPEDQSLQFTLSRYLSTYGELMPSQLLWLGQVRQTDGSRVDAKTQTARYQWQPVGSALIKLKVNGWHTATKSQNKSYSEELNLNPDEKEVYHRWGLDISNTSRPLGEHNPLELEFGIAWQKEHLDTHSLNPDSPFLSGRQGGRREFSAFINSRWHPYDWLEMSAGLRHTRFNSKDHRPLVPSSDSPFCRDLDGDEACDALTYRNQNSGYTPILSTTLTVTDGISIYARYAEGMRMPSLFEASSGASTQPALDVPIKPEHSINKEVGINILQDDLISSDDSLRLKLSYFRNHTRDYLTRTSPNLWEKDAKTLIFVTRNIDSVEFHGNELTVQYDNGWFYLNASGTRYQHIELCHTGSFRRQSCNDYGIANSYINNMIPPNKHASATLGLRLLEQKLDSGIRSTWMGERNQTPEFNNDTLRGRLRPVPWHDYQILDFYASYQANEHLTLDFNIDNLTDQYYLDALGLGLIPAPGRTVRIGLDMRY